MSSSRALLSSAAAMLVAGIYLLHMANDSARREPAQPGTVSGASGRTGVAWSTLPSEQPRPPAAAKGGPPPRLGEVAGASAPLAAQPDVATIRANLAKAVSR